METNDLQFKEITHWENIISSRKKWDRKMICHASEKETRLMSYFNMLFDSRTRYSIRASDIRFKRILFNLKAC